MTIIKSEVLSPQSPHSLDIASPYTASLPRYACPDLTNKPLNWAKALAEQYAEYMYSLYFYYTRCEGGGMGCVEGVWVGAVEGERVI